MTKKKSVKKETNKNKNVNKNNINITINHPKKRTYKKRSSTGNPKQGQAMTIFNPTIINQIPTQQPQQDLNKMAYEYNKPSSKSSPPAPPPIPTPILIPVVKKPLSAPSKNIKPLFATSPTKPISIPVERKPLQAPSKNIKPLFASPINDFNTPAFKSQIPVSYGSDFSNSDSMADSGSFIRLTNLKPARNKETFNNMSTFYNPNYETDSTFDSYTPSTSGTEKYFTDSPLVTDNEFFDQTPINNQSKKNAFDALNNSRIENKLNRANENKFMSQEDNKSKVYEYSTNYEPLEEAEKQLENKNITILRPKLKETFESQIPLSEGFHTPEKRRETILPTYENNDTSIVETPNVLDQKPKRKRRTKAQMEEARANVFQDTPNTKLKKKANELMTTLKQLNSDAEEKDKLRKDTETRTFMSPRTIRVKKRAESIQRYETAVGNLANIKEQLVELENTGKKALIKKSQKIKIA